MQRKTIQYHTILQYLHMSIIQRYLQKYHACCPKPAVVAPSEAFGTNAAEVMADSLAPAGVAVVPHAHPTCQAMMAKAHMNHHEPLVQIDYDPAANCKKLRSAS